MAFWKSIIVSTSALLTARTRSPRRNPARAAAEFRETSCTASTGFETSYPAERASRAESSATVNPVRDSKTPWARSAVSGVAEIRASISFFPRTIDGNREADPLPRGQDRGADSDHVAVRVQQRPAGVAGVDRRVGLDEVVVAAALGVHRTMQRRDDAHADALVEPERIADGDGRLAEHQVRRGAQRRGRELPIDLDLEDGEIPTRIRSDDARGVVGAVVEADLDAATPRHHVIVREHIAALVEDEPGTEGGAHLIAGSTTPEEQLPGIVRGECPDHFLGVDVHHRRPGALDGQHQGCAPRRAGRGGERGKKDERDHSARGAELAERGELGLDVARLPGEVFERLEVPLVLLLVQQPLLDVALDHAAIEVLQRDLILLLGHCAAPSRGARLLAHPWVIVSPCPALCPPASTPSSTARPPVPRSTWWALSSGAAPPSCSSASSRPGRVGV